MLSVNEGLAGFEPRPLREHYVADDLILCVQSADGEGVHVLAVKEMYAFSGADVTLIS